jgi:DNA-binding CsgD family transcriptional regulator/tetratricopeptide (TPR) repeat protein/nucleoside-triphosphatase THEP1
MAERSDPPESVSGSTFAGREVELDLLLAALGDLDRSGARTVLIGGEAGIGKTRLVEELRSRARADGTLVATGVCTPTEGGGLPYGPVVGVLRDLSRRLDDETVASLLGPARVRLEQPEINKKNVFEALLECLVALGERSRVVVVFEDLQWADAASVGLVDFLARNLGDSPVLLVGTHRTDELDDGRGLSRTLTELGRHRAVSQIELAGLDRDSISAVMVGILGRQPDWVLLDAVHNRCGGNPFFAEELTAARDTSSLPSVLRNVIMVRVERLTPAARHVVALAATAGISIDHRLLAAASNLESGDLGTAIAEAVELNVLAVDGRSRFRFRHALQREAIYETLLPADRTNLHRRLALALSANPQLAATGPGYAAVELADHWWEADEWSEALFASMAAADAMASMLALAEAYAHYERAVSACEHLTDADGRDAVDWVGLLLKAADAAYLTGMTQRVVELITLVLERVGPTSDPRRAAVALTMLGRNAWSVGDDEGAFLAFRRAAELLPTDPPSPELAAVVAEEARGLMLVSRTAEAERRCHDAIAIAIAVGDRVSEGHALSTLGCCIAERGDYDDGLARIREALAIAEQMNNADQISRAYTNLTHVLLLTCRLEEAAQSIFDSTATDERIIGARLSDAGGNAVEALIRLGRWDQADDVLSRMDARGTGVCIFGPHGVGAMVDIRRGRFASAAQRIEWADELSSGGIRTASAGGQFHLLLAELALEEGRPGDASVAIEHALAAAAGTDDNTYRPEMCAFGIRALADEYESARSRGRRIDTDKVQRLAAALVEQCERHVATWGEDDGRPSRFRALLAMSEAEESRLHRSDADLWDRAALRWDVAAEPHNAAYCRWREAEAALASKGARERAVAATRAAWQTAVRIGAEPLQARVERLAQRARISLGSTDPSAADDDGARTPRQTVAEDLGLTAREVDVLVQLTLGRTDRQIGEELFISKKTVSVHVSNILRKLDAVNRIDAAEIGQRAGL